MNLMTIIASFRRINWACAHFRSIAGLAGLAFSLVSSPQPSVCSL